MVSHVGMILSTTKGRFLAGTFQSTDFHEHWMLQHDTPPSLLANVSSSPQQKRLNSIQETLYLVDTDQVPVLLQRLEEATSPQPLHLLSNPVASVVRKRGRLPGSKNRSNQRDKSRCEYVSGNQCVNCWVNGHNSLTCPKWTNKLTFSKSIMYSMHSELLFACYSLL